MKNVCVLRHEVALQQQQRHQLVINLPLLEVAPTAWNYKLILGHIGATWRIRLNLCIVQPTPVHNENGK